MLQSDANMDIFNIFLEELYRQLWTAAITNNLSYFEKQSLAKKMFLKISQKSYENTCVRVSFLTNLQACNFIKKRALEEEVTFLLLSKLSLKRSKFQSSFKNIRFKTMLFWKTKNVQTLNFLLIKKRQRFFRFENFNHKRSLFFECQVAELAILFHLFLTRSS